MCRGVELILKKQYPTLEEVKEIIINYTNKYKVKPTMKEILENCEEIPNSSKTIKKYYGITLVEIIDLCNIKYKKRNNYIKYTD